MKKIFLYAGWVSFLLAIGFYEIKIKPEIIVVEKPSPEDVDVYYLSEQMFSYFNKNGCTENNYCGDFEWIKSVVSQTLFWTKFWNIEHTNEKILVNFLQESWFDPHAKSNVGAYGITQIYGETEHCARKLLLDKGIKLDSLQRPSVQIALGVTVFYMKLLDAKGDPWEAIERYNGSGKYAKAHRKKVFALYKKVYYEY